MDGGQPVIERDLGNDLQRMDWGLHLLCPTRVRQRRRVLGRRVPRLPAQRQFDASSPTVWPAVQAAANFLEDNVGSNGLGPEDNSIWEQTDQYNTFTEAFYVAGLRAAAHLALDRGQLERRRCLERRRQHDPVGRATLL